MVTEYKMLNRLGLNRPIEIFHCPFYERNIIE